MSDESDRCVCGHLSNHHYAVSGRCMRIITRHRSGDLGCTCKAFRPETPAAAFPEGSHDALETQPASSSPIVVQADPSEQENDKG